MSESPRISGQMQLRAHHSPFTRAVMLPAQRFIQIEETAGGPLILAAALALIWANSPWAAGYHSLWETEITLDLGFLEPISHSLKIWINDALLPLFFFVIGLEIKREVVRGELSSWRRAALPVVVALGGMVIPALVYTGFNLGADGYPNGWGIPLATDIAFALAVLALVGDRVPYSLKLLLLAFAAVDDIGGVLVIAIFYSHGLNWGAIGVIAGLLAIVFMLKRVRVWTLSVYCVLGVLVWFAFLESGIHATIAGVILGMMAPARPPFSREQFAQRAEDLATQFRGAFDRWKSAQSEEAPAVAVAAGLHAESQQTGTVGLGEPGSNGADTEDKATLQKQRADARAEQDAVLGQYEELINAVEAPVDRVARLVNPWVSYAILPLFALANAGVTLNGSIGNPVTNPAAIGVALGLIFGKPIGCVLFAWIGTRLGVCTLPRNCNWTQMLGIGLLAGIGFTVALFIAELAFGHGKGPLDGAKLAIFFASLVAGVSGFLFMLFASRSADGRVDLDAEPVEH